MDGFTFKGGGSASPQALGLLPVRIDANFIRQSKEAPDAEKIVARHHEMNWLAVNGAILRETELKAAKSRKKADKAQKGLDKAIERREGLDERITMARYRDGDEDAPQGRDIPFSEWNWYDRLIALGCGITMVLLLFLGVANVATTILESGAVTFLEKPYLAWMLGGLVPAAAMSIKSGYHLMTLDSSRRVYATAMFGLSGVLILIWVVLFAQSFEGVTGEIVWDDFDETGQDAGAGLGTWRNIVQILGEIFIGASLFLVIDRIQATYSSSWTAKNPKWVQANKRVEALEGPTAALVAEADADDARTLQMKAALEVHIGEAVSLLRDMQAGKRS